MARILIVDDDPLTVELVRATLEHAGHTVDSMDDPSAVVERTAESEPDALILDVMLPGRSGFEILEELRGDERCADLPILMLTGLSAGSDRVDGLRGGADDYLVKPFEPDELLLRVERLAARPSAPPSGGRRSTASDDPPQPSIRALLQQIEADENDGNDDRPPLRLGRYEVLEKLAEGGMGILFRGRDPKLRRRVALKTVRLDRRDSSVDDAESSERLVHEAVLGARVSHPHLVTVFDVGLLADGAFLAMELVEGSNLAALVDEGGVLEAPRALPILAAVAWGLEAAHRAGIVHRDVKPENVLLGRDGSVKVTDFGLAALVSSLSGDDEAVFGTPGYIAPEVLNGGAHDACADVFALGVLAYRVLVGEKPFRGRTVPAILVKTLTQEPPSLREQISSLPPGLDGLVQRMMAKDPTERPPIREVADLLQARCAENGWRWTPRELPASPRLPAATASRLVTPSRDLSVPSREQGPRFRA